MLVFGRPAPEDLCSSGDQGWRIALQIQDAFSRYQNMDLQFSADMREHKFCVKIIAALEEVDVDAWQEVCVFSPFTWADWCTKKERVF